MPKYNNCGIYSITNSITGDMYIGQSSNLKNRQYGHFNDLRKNKHHSTYLQNAYNKYGESVFEFKIILFCDKSNLTYYEQQCVFAFNSVYNMMKNCFESRYGVPQSEAARLKISMATKGSNNPMFGKHHTEDSKKKMSENLKGKNTKALGRVVSQETRNKLSLINKGKILSSETILKIRATRKYQVGKYNPNYGNHLSEESKKKISESNKGRKWTDSTRKKITEYRKKNGHSWTGKNHSDETKSKLSKAHTGSATIKKEIILAIKEMLMCEKTIKEIKNELGVSYTTIKKVKMGKYFFAYGIE